MKIKDFPVLIIGYQRPKQIKDILEVCREARIPRIYISIDGPKDISAAAASNLLKIQNLVLEYSECFEEITHHFFSENVGCAAHVLSACDWVFAKEDFAVVLEDDCIPTLEFFEYVEFMMSTFCHDPEILLICGTQFAPKDLQNFNVIKSNYSLTWGWATSKAKWGLITQAIKDAEKNTLLNLLSLNPEDIYWHEGSRRASLGFVDVWDTILVGFLVKNNLFALLPNENLIRNVGNDSVATHTESHSPWAQAKTGKFTRYHSGEVRTSETTQKWLRDNFYVIKRRHLISTRITRIIDRFRTPRLDSLNNRWERASKLF
jgi:hypothetical protein